MARPQILHQDRGPERDTGGESYATVEIIFAVEDSFGFRMTSAEMESTDAIPALLAIIEARMPLASAT